MRQFNAGAFYETQKAAKPRPCGYSRSTNCGGIKTGEYYEREAVPPWVPIIDDVDDEGRPVGSPSGEWQVVAYHSACRDEIEGGLL